MQGQHAEWVTMAVAAEMFKVSPAKISRMASNGEIRTRGDKRDKRVKLVNVDELRRYFEENPYTTGDEQEVIPITEWRLLHYVLADGQSNR